LHVLPKKLFGEKERLTQVLTNLVHNALKFSLGIPDITIVVSYDQAAAGLVF